MIWWLYLLEAESDDSSPVWIDFGFFLRWWNFPSTPSSANIYIPHNPLCMLSFTDVRRQHFARWTVWFEWTLVCVRRGAERCVQGTRLLVLSSAWCSKLQKEKQLLLFLCRTAIKRTETVSADRRPWNKHSVNSGGQRSRCGSEELINSEWEGGVELEMRGWSDEEHTEALPSRGNQKRSWKDALHHAWHSASSHWLRSDTVSSRQWRLQDIGDALRLWWSSKVEKWGVFVLKCFECI